MKAFNLGSRTGVAEADKGPERDLAALIRRHECDIRACILSLVPHWADADDIFQETCLRLVEKQQQHLEERSVAADFRGWAITIAYYQVLTYRKRKDRERSRFSDLAMELIKEEQAAASTERERRLAFLAACLEKLDGEARLLLRLFYGKGLRLKETATRLERTESATYKMHSRIRHLLRACVERSLRVES